jgi:hypothetical protein
MKTNLISAIKSLNVNNFKIFAKHAFNSISYIYYSINHVIVIKSLIIKKYCIFIIIIKLITIN